MTEKWLWKILIVPACLILILSVIGTFYPYLYIDFYLEQTLNLSFEALSTTSQGIARLLEVIFRANGLGMTMSGILGIFVILFAFRKGEKWSIPALALVGGIGFIGEIILEIMIFLS